MEKWTDEALDRKVDRDFQEYLNELYDRFNGIPLNIRLTSVKFSQDDDVEVKLVPIDQLLQVEDKSARPMPGICVRPMPGIEKFTDWQAFEESWKAQHKKELADRMIERLTNSRFDF